MTTATATYHATDFHTRWMIRRDFPAVMRIETETGGDWTEDDFFRLLRQRNCIGMVAEENWFNRPGPLAGFFLYELHRTKLVLLKFVTLPGENRDATAAELFAKLVYKLTSHRRQRLDVSAIIRPEWLSLDVRALCKPVGVTRSARTRSVPYLPILADALEDAGCDERWLLDELRTNTPLARKLYTGMRKVLR